MLPSARYCCYSKETPYSIPAESKQCNSNPCRWRAFSQHTSLLKFKSLFTWIITGETALKTVPHHPCTQNTHANMLSSEDFVPTDRPAVLQKLILSTHQWLPVLPPGPTPIPYWNILIIWGSDWVIFMVDSSQKCSRTANRPIQKQELRSFQYLNSFKSGFNGARQR